ncbi:MAG: hypothetical protein KJO40_13510 [Deltaproteobacteria bacterium]|nr:hypothetical protein [Deltaproteobacteria bacterium]
MLSTKEQQLHALVRKLVTRQKAIESQHQAILDKYEEFVQACEEQPRSITQEIDSIPGRRIFYTLSDRVDFDNTLAGRRGDPLSFLVSQDGPFIATHWPLAMWKVNAPDTATNFGAWRPVSTWPLPTQELGTDLIDISWELSDSGSQRAFQNEAAGPVFSRPDNLIPLPVPTLFAPNTVIVVNPTYERIAFDTGAQEPTTGGELYFGFPGYKIVNL